MTQQERQAQARRAIARALELRPTILKVDEGFWCVASSTEGEGYLLERNADGDLWCPCAASQHGLCCFHRAALGIHLGTIPASWLPPAEALAMPPASCGYCGKAYAPVELAVAS